MRDGRTKDGSILLLFKFLKFYDKKLFCPSALRKYAFENMLSPGENHTEAQLQTPALILDITLLDDDLLCSGIANFALL